MFRPLNPASSRVFVVVTTWSRHVTLGPSKCNAGPSNALYLSTDFLGPLLLHVVYHQYLGGTLNFGPPQ